MGGAYPPVPWARELARRGHRVLYVQAEADSIPAGERNTVVVSAKELGMPERAFRRAWHGIPPGDLESFIRNVMARVRDFEKPDGEIRAAVWSDPFVPFVLSLPQLRALGYVTLYACKDDFESMSDLGYRFANGAAESYLVNECDFSTVVSTLLLDKLSGRYPNATIRLLRQGFDPAQFRLPAVPAAPPADLARSEHTLGFWGLVNDFNVDEAIISYLARERPNWAINLIGPVDSDPARTPIGDRLRSFPNVHLLGGKPHGELAYYLHWFDVAMIPYPSHPFNLSRDPIKALEYLAGYKPVVAAHVPPLAGMPGVTLADTPDQFLAAVEHALQQPVDCAKLDDYLGGCTWSARVDALLKWINETPRRTEESTALVPEQFYKPANLPPNLRAFVAHAEQLLEERTAYIEQMEGQWRRTREYVSRLERTHPAIRLRRAARREVR